MFKAIYFTDTQITGRTPESRKEPLIKAIYRKFYEITEKVKVERPDFVIIGGDFFDTPAVSYRIVGIIAEFIKEWQAYGARTLVVPGNHDLYGYTIDDIEQTALGLLHKTGLIEIIIKGEPVVYHKEGVDYIIEGQEYYHGIDAGNMDDYLMTRVQPTQYPQLKILIPHAMLLEKPFHPDVPHHLIKDVAVNTDANLILGSHYHPGWNKQVVNNVMFYNPGSLLRMERGNGSMREIKIGILTADTQHFDVQDYVLQTALPYTQIFDDSKGQAAKQQQVLLANLKSTINTNQTTLTQGTNVVTILKDTITNSPQLDPVVAQMSESILQEAIKNNPNDMLLVKGYMEALSNKTISKLTTHNFQSHADTVVDFTPGLNVIVGESNAGKTVVKRVLDWIFNDKPKGKGFMRAGTKDTWAKVEFSDGTWLQRSRTKTSAGEYQVCMDDGSVLKFNGFTNKLPIEILNTHQMPNIKVTKDREINLNVADQFDNNFMLGMTGFERAAAVGKLTGTDAVDFAIQTTASIAMAAKKTIKTSTTEIDRLATVLEGFNDLPAYETMVITYEAAIQFAEDTYNRLTHVNRYINQMNMLNVQKKQAEADLAYYDRIGLIDPIVSEVEVMLSSLKRITDFSSSLSSIIESKRILNHQVSLFHDPVEIEDTLVEAEKLLAVLSKVQAYVNQLTHINDQKQEIEHYRDYDEQAPITLLNEIDADIQRIADIQDYMTKLKEIELFRSRYQQEADAFEKTEHEERAQQNIHELQRNTKIKELKICPTCGTELKAKQVNYMAKGGCDHE